MRYHGCYRMTRRSRPAVKTLRRRCVSVIVVVGVVPFILITIYYKIHFWCHRAGLFFMMVCCLLPLREAGVLDHLWSRMHWKSVIFYYVLWGSLILMAGLIASAATPYALSASPREMLLLSLKGDRAYRLKECPVAKIVLSDKWRQDGIHTSQPSADHHSNHPMNPKHPQADVSMEIQMENMPPSQSVPAPSDSRPRLASMHVPSSLLDYEPEDPVIRFVNHVYFWCHRAGLIFTVCCLLPAMPFNAFFVGMTEILMSSLVKPWVGVLDQVWSRLHWKTVVFYCCLVLAVGLAIS
ncbi:hypothetical protein PROFUN_10535 [Planoprotostelium fungivorum]|uniref:Uncharacterized protein n=1 Tax=Planoprotostelium fungivorum TaxID=1890364 RepID=A0A2P6N6Q3_9EUKA|nr:hypothetical protein PROFUN_10535 [Planoprotostelium fungivorum]